VAQTAETFMTDKSSLTCSQGFTSCWIDLDIRTMQQLVRIDRAEKKNCTRETFSSTTSQFRPLLSTPNFFVGETSLKPIISLYGVL
jgi:hypothetical protein